MIRFGALFGIVMCTLMLASCGGDGGGEPALLEFAEAEPNNQPDQVNIVQTRVAINANSGQDDVDWFAAGTIDTPRDFRIDAFVTGPVAVFFEVFPIDGRFENSSQQEIMDGDGQRFAGRFIPTGSTPAIVIRASWIAGAGPYRVEVRAGG